MDDKHMTEDEQRSVLESIARDEDAHPRDRIAAIRALQAVIERQHESKLDLELDEILRQK